MKLIKSAPDYSIIVPTYNEKENLVEVVRRLDKVLSGINWEVIFVDDNSPDCTSVAARGMARRDTRVRCIERIGRRGLSSAVIEGMLSSSAPYLAVMDGDLQHDVDILPKLLNKIRSGDWDLVVGSRYVDDGGITDWNKRRAAASKFSTWLGKKALKIDIRDPMSGYFAITHDMMRRCVLNGMSGIGFKILLDLTSSSPKPLRILEVPYTFSEREKGESKLDIMVAWEFLIMLLYKRLGGVIPQRLLSFSFVGSFGVLVHFFILGLLLHVMSFTFMASQLTAVLLSMVSNFTLNNLLTYRDLRLTGWNWVWGLITFTITCSLGLAANVGVASVMYDGGTNWGLSAIVGILCGLVWNFLVTSIFTWHSK